MNVLFIVNSPEDIKSICWLCKDLCQVDSSDVEGDNSFMVCRSCNQLAFSSANILNLCNDPEKKVCHTSVLDRESAIKYAETIGSNTVGEWELNDNSKFFLNTIYRLTHIGIPLPDETKIGSIYSDFCKLESTDKTHNWYRIPDLAYIKELPPAMLTLAGFGTDFSYKGQCTGCYF